MADTRVSCCTGLRRRVSLPSASCLVPIIDEGESAVFVSFLTCTVCLNVQFADSSVAATADAHFGPIVVPNIDDVTTRLIHFCFSRSA